MTVENCLKLAKFCRDNNDEAGAKIYEIRSWKKKGKRERLRAIEEASIKQLEAIEEARLQALERELGIEKKETKPKAETKSKEKKDGSGSTGD